MFGWYAGFDPLPQGSTAQVTTVPPEPAMIGLPVVWHAGVKKSTEAQRLVTFAQGLSSEVRVRNEVKK